jgi:hypothetical protein
MTSSYDDYCEDRFNNDKSLVSCYLLKRSDELQLRASTLEGYRIYEIPQAQAYIRGESIPQGFSYSPQVITSDTSLDIMVAEPYSPQFKWTCGDERIETQSENNGLTQSATLPANSDCEFRYHKSTSVIIAEMISYGLFGLTVILGIIYGAVSGWRRLSHLWNR